jgi:uncharacterized protein YndB with AHSA1/START domain
METAKSTKIIIEAIINAGIEKVWEHWTNPKHIIHWNFASDDWHSPRAENDLRNGGKFSWRMESKDGTMGFDFTGKYDKVETNKIIKYTLDDNRKVEISFVTEGYETRVTETFEAETIHSLELQKEGWQAILNNFKKYIESGTSPDELHFEISIDAEVGKVYKTMIDKDRYSEWTAVFNPSSRYEGSWKQGSEIHFFGTEKDKSTVGMVSIIKENIPNRFISIEHQAIIHDGKKISSGPEADLWSGSLENYIFTSDNGKTKLTIEMKIPRKLKEEYKNYFLDTWPKALNKLKSICEA